MPLRELRVPRWSDPGVFVRWPQAEADLHPDEPAYGQGFLAVCRLFALNVGQIYYRVQLTVSYILK